MREKRAEIIYRRASISTKRGFADNKKKREKLERQGGQKEQPRSASIATKEAPPSKEKIKRTPLLFLPGQNKGDKPKGKCKRPSWRRVRLCAARHRAYKKS
jgi:hypothetical protein